jgi:tRNA threonylcarbamoyladenosine biosynthesis protein TsaB
MNILAVDTTTAGGSVALFADDNIIETVAGDPRRSHGERLAADIVNLLSRHRLEASAIDLFAVAAGPGSFTGLRIGLASVQGLALVNKRLVVPVSALDALAAAAARDVSSDGMGREASIGVWMDAQRQQVFSGRYIAAIGGDRRQTALTAVEEPRSEYPKSAIDRWSGDPPSWMIGGGALQYRSLMTEAKWPTTLIEPTPVLAPEVARLAAAKLEAGGAIHPGELRPIYLRKPDAELARDRREAHRSKA